MSVTKTYTPRCYSHCPACRILCGLCPLEGSSRNNLSQEDRLQFICRCEGVGWLEIAFWRKIADSSLVVGTIGEIGILKAASIFDPVVVQQLLYE
jgi:hypothetical protein